MAFAKAKIKKQVDEVLPVFCNAYFGVGIILTKGKIEHEDVEAIACAVDNSLNLAASGSAAKSLLRAGGESLQTECRERFPSGIKYGDVIVLGGGNLKCKKVFLTSMPDYEVEDETLDSEKSKVLSDALSAILDNAIQEKVKTIVIPAVGFGKLGLSAENVASIYFNSVKIKKSAFGALRNIKFVLNDKSVFEEFERHLFTMKGCLGQIILHIAGLNGKTEMCQYIVDRHPSHVNIRDNNGMHILHFTAASGSIYCLQMITDIVIQDKGRQHREQYMLKCLTNDGQTILHVACLTGKTEMCQYIFHSYPSLVHVKDNNGHTILHDTAASGSVDCLQWITDIVILDKDKQHRELYMLKCLTIEGETILHSACLKGKTEMCQYIVNIYPSLVHVKDNIGCHILHKTAFSGSVDCLKRITDIVIPDKGKQHREQYMLKCLTNDGQTILHFACSEGKTEMCQYIIDNYPSLIYVKDNLYSNILHVTAFSGSVDCLKRITDIVIQDKDKQHREQYMLKCLTINGQTILHVACLNGKTEMCQYIVNIYPSLVHVKANIGCHILHFTAQSGSVDCLKRITDIVIPDKGKQHREKYMLECLTNDGRTILDIASLAGKTEMCRYLLDNYPSLVNIKNKDGMHILHFTATSGSVDCLKRITDIVIQDKDRQHREQYMLKCVSPDGRTILHYACHAGKTEMCQYIVDNYPSLLNIRENNGFHILHFTAMSDSVDCLKRITDIVIPDKGKQHREKYMLKCLTNDGKTILHIASLKGKTEMCRYLLDNYPSLVNIKNKDGIHILHCTAASGSVDCLKRITDIVIQDKDRQHREQYMLKCVSHHGRTILHFACLYGKTEMCQYIVDNYPSLLNIRGNNGFHIFHFTAMSDSVDCLKRITDIVMQGKNKQHREDYVLRCLSNCGKTILHIASLAGKTEMCRYILNNYPSLVKIRDNDGMHFLYYMAVSGRVDFLSGLRT